jgi:hypothetical protein
MQWPLIMRLNREHLIFDIKKKQLYKHLHQILQSYASTHDVYQSMVWRPDGSSRRHKRPEKYWVRECTRDDV